MKINELESLGQREAARLRAATEMISRSLMPSLEFTKYLDEINRTQQTLAQAMRPILEQQRGLERTLEPMIELQGRIAATLEPLARLERSAAHSLSGSTFAVRELLDGIALPEPAVFRILRDLSRIDARSFHNVFETIDHSALHSALEAATTASLGLSTSTAGIFAKLIQDDLSQISAAAIADAATFDDATVVDVLVALLERLRELGRHPQVQLFLITLLGTIAGAEWQALRSESQHEKLIAEERQQTAEERRQTAVLQQIHDHLAVNDYGRGNSLPEVRAIVTRNVHLRAEPSSRARSFGVLTPGDQVLILGRDKGWLQVSAGLPGGQVQVGWVYAPLVKAVV